MFDKMWNISTNIEDVNKEYNNSTKNYIIDNTAKWTTLTLLLKSEKPYKLFKYNKYKNSVQNQQHFSKIFNNDCCLLNIISTRKKINIKKEDIKLNVPTAKHFVQLK